jgi:hypothetical protein
MATLNQALVDDIQAELSGSNHLFCFAPIEISLP